jgi:outer membrane protein assembly factor BamB
MHPSIPKNLIIAALVAACLNLSTSADDWPQWFGPNRDGVWRETGIIDRFPTNGPAVKWRTKIGAGYSGPAVSEGKVYITDRTPDTQRDKSAKGAAENPGTDRVLCLSEETGAIIWEHAYASNYSVSYPSGPRATPTVDGNRVYSLGTEGIFLCLDANSGKRLWQHDLKEEYQPKTQIWGHSASPLVAGELVIVLPGGANTTAVAFNKVTGKEVWRALSSKESGYCHPIVIESAGKRQLIVWHPEAINSLNPTSGEVYWSIPWNIRAGLTISTPRLKNNQLFFTSFYNGSTLLQLAPDQPSAEIVWQSKKASERDTTELHSITSTPFWKGDYIYGVCSYGQLRCIRANNGERIWETFAATTDGNPVRWATAFITPHEDRYFLFNEHGELIIAHLSPDGYEEIDRTKLLEATNSDARGRLVVWSHPAYANRHIIARNDHEIIRVSLTH